MSVRYYTHRYGGDPAQLDRAEARLNWLNANRGDEDLYLAPWIEYARREFKPALVWKMIGHHIADKYVSAVAHDLDGGNELSPGQKREDELARKYGKSIVYVTIPKGWLKWRA